MNRLFFIIIITLLIVSCKSKTKEVVSKKTETVKILSTVSSPKTGRPISLSQQLNLKILETNSFSLDDLRILRNEIFARKGYIFKSEDLNNYFSKFEWYNPRFKSDEIDNYLTEVDKQNIEVIAGYETILKENNWLTKTYENFSFKDFIACLPEFSLPIDFDNIEFKDPLAVDRFYALDYKFKEKHYGYGFDGEPFGKISINDTITALGLVAASDLYAFYFVAIVDNKGNILDSFDIPVSQQNSNDFDEPYDEKQVGEVISTYTHTVITKDFTRIAKNWEVKTVRDTLGNIIEQTCSDTAIGKSEIYEITKYLD